MAEDVAASGSAASASDEPPAGLLSGSDRLVALYDFDPSTIDWPFRRQRPLPLQTGRVIQIIYDDGSEWALGHPVGQPENRGYFPKNYTVSVAEYQDMMRDYGENIAAATDGEGGLGGAASMLSTDGGPGSLGGLMEDDADGARRSEEPFGESFDREARDEDAPTSSGAPADGMAQAEATRGGPSTRAAPEQPHVQQRRAPGTDLPEGRYTSHLAPEGEARILRGDWRFMQPDGAPDPRHSGSMTRPERDFVRRHLPLELQDHFLRKLAPLKEVVHRNATRYAEAKALYRMDARVRATTCRVAAGIEPPHVRIALERGEKTGARWVQMFRPAFNDIVNESYKAGCNACILSRLYLGDAQAREQFLKLHVRDARGTLWFELQRRKPYVFYRRMEFVDVMMFHPDAWGFPDTANVASPHKGEPFELTHGWLAQENADVERELRSVEFSYTLRLRRLPEKTFQAVALGKVPEWLKALQSWQPETSTSITGSASDPLTSPDPGSQDYSLLESQAGAPGALKDFTVMHESREPKVIDPATRMRDTGLVEEAEVLMTVDQMRGMPGRDIGADVLDMQAINCRLKGENGLRIFLRSRGHPDSMKQTTITPKLVKDMAAQLGIWGECSHYWYAIFALRYPLNHEWEVLMKGDTRWYLHVPTDNLQPIHPMIQRFREHLWDCQQNEFLWDNRERVRMKCSECGIPDASVWCMQCTDYFCAACFFQTHGSLRGRKHMIMPIPGSRYLTKTEVERFAEQLPLLNVGFSNRRRFLATDNQSDKTGSRSGDTWLYFSADTFQVGLQQAPQTRWMLKRLNPPRLAPDAEGYYFNFASNTIAEEPNLIIMKASEQKALITLQRCYRGTKTRRRLRQEDAATLIIQKTKRMWDCRRVYGDHGHNAQMLRGWYSRWKAKQDKIKLEVGIAKNQALFRGSCARHIFHGKIRAMTRFQAAFRGVRGRRHMTILTAAVMTIQRLYRGHLYGRKPLEELHQNAARIQALARGVALRSHFKLRAKAATQLQARWRGILARKRVQRARAAGLMLQTNWRRFQAQLDIKIMLYERLDSIRQQRRELIRAKLQYGAACIVQRNWRRYSENRKVIQMRKEKAEADKRIQTLLVAIYAAAGALHHHVHPWWRHLPAELQEVLEQIKGSLQRTIAQVQVTGKLANEEIGRRGLRVAHVRNLTYVQDVQDPDLASHLLLSVSRHLLSLVPVGLFPATVKWASYAVAHKAVDLAQMPNGNSQGYFERQEIPIGKNLPPHPGDTLVTLWRDTGMIKHHCERFIRLPEESLPMLVLYNLSPHHRQVFLTAQVLITMRQALDASSLSTDDHLKFQGLDATSGAQLMEVLASELEHQLPHDWPKLYGTVASLAQQMTAHVGEQTPLTREPQVVKPVKKAPSKKSPSRSKAKSKAGRAKKRESVDSGGGTADPDAIETPLHRDDTQPLSVVDGVGRIEEGGSKIAIFNYKALLRVVQQTAYLMRDQDQLLDSVLSGGGLMPGGGGVRQSRYISVTDKLFEMADGAKHDHCSFVLAVVLFHLVLRALILRVLYHRAAMTLQKRWRYIKEKGQKAYAVGPSITIQRCWRGLRDALWVSRRDDAAVRIQHSYRVYRWKRRSDELLTDTLRLQRLWRGAIQRKWLRRCHMAATVVQRHARGLLVRVVLDLPGRNMARRYQGEVNALLKARRSRTLSEPEVIARTATVVGKMRADMAKHRTRNIDLRRMAVTPAHTRETDRAAQLASRGVVQPARLSIFEPMVFALLRLAPPAAPRYGAPRSKVMGQIYVAKRELDRSLPREHGRRLHAAARRGNAAIIARRLAKKRKLSGNQDGIIEEELFQSWAINQFEPFRM